MKESRQKVYFHYLTEPFFFPERTRLKNFILDLCKREGKKVEQLNYIFCTDEYLLEINKQYLKHNDYTDIITFELSPKGNDLISDIYVSVERVKENAGSFHTSFLIELYRVMFHGALHLCGYKDKNAEDKELMRKTEDLYLKALFVSRETKRGN